MKTASPKVADRSGGIVISESLPGVEAPEGSEVCWGEGPMAEESSTDSAGVAQGCSQSMAPVAIATTPMTTATAR